MITWRFSLIAFLALAACGEAGAPSFLAGGGLTRAAEPLTEASLARGALTLRPPAGYCVDRSALTQRFAAMARCDALGGDAPDIDVPLALITISVTPGADAPVLGDASEEVLERRDSDLIALVRLRGSPLQDGFAGTYWRGAGQAGDYAISLALFAPEAGRAAGDAGASLLTGVMAGLKSAAPPREDVAEPPRTAENPLGQWISGLLN